MSPKPSVTHYAGAAALLTVLAFYTIRSLTQGLSDELGLLGILLALSVIQISLTYLMVDSWMEYATETRESTRSGNVTTGD